MGKHACALPFLQNFRGKKESSKLLQEIYVPFSKEAPEFTCLQNKSFENTVCFPTVFPNRLEKLLPFLSNLKLSSAQSFSWDES